MYATGGNYRFCQIGIRYRSSTARGQALGSHMEMQPCTLFDSTDQNRTPQVKQSLTLVSDDVSRSSFRRSSKYC
jgi:hypothetical protein